MSRSSANTAPRPKSLRSLAVELIQVTALAALLVWLFTR